MGVINLLFKKNNTDEVHEEDAKFRDLLESAYDVIVLIDSAGTVQFANSHLYILSGYKPEELVGKKIEMLLPDRYREIHIKNRDSFMKSAISRRMGENMDLFLRKKDGKEVPVDIALTPVHTRDGLVVGASIRDITTRKKIEDQQRFLAQAVQVLSESLGYEERIQKMADLIVPKFADFATVYEWENEKLKVMAASHGDVSWVDLLRETAEKYAALVVANVKDVSAIRSENCIFLERLDDEVLKKIAQNEDHLERLRKIAPKSYISLPLVSRNKVIGAIALGMSFSDRRFSYTDLPFFEALASRSALSIENAKLYDEATHATKMREEVLAMVSHDLRNPLGRIKMSSELILSQINSGKPGFDPAKLNVTLERAVKQMERMIGDLLNFSSIQAGTLSIDPSLTDVSYLIQSGIDSVAHLAEKKNIKLEKAVGPGLKTVDCDSDRILQVLGNLLENAIKFSPENSTISLSALAEATEVVFKIEDQGPGIAKENIDHVFDRFWQAKETSKLGSGLGLAIAKGIITSHKGRIWVESELSKGSSFFFTLPMLH